MKRLSKGNGETDMIAGNYIKHTRVWDWAGDDRRAEFEFWNKMGMSYGRKVLSLMAAIRQAAA